MKEKKLEVTPLDQWEMPTVLLPLPSGRVMEVRVSLELQNCIAAGRIPNPLLEPVLEIIKGGKSAGQELESLQEDDPSKLLQFINWMVEEMAVNPRVWNGEGERPEGTITHDHLTDDDHNAIMAFALSGPAAMTPFRDGEERGDAGPDGEEIRAEAEPSGEDS